MLRRLWLIFAQATTVGLALLFIVSTLRPEWLRDAPRSLPRATRRRLHPAAGRHCRTPHARAALGSYADAARKAMPAVVNVYTTKEVRRQPFAGDPFFSVSSAAASRSASASTGLGSGVIATTDGYIITNNHVVRRPTKSRSRSATAGDCRPSSSAPTRRPTSPAAVEASDLPTSLSAARTRVRVGDIVLAIGNPFNVGQTVTMGIVSALGRSNLGINRFENFVQTDAAINQGNSGGALVDTAGNLVGINRAIFSRDGGSIGIGFAIPTVLVATSCSSSSGQARSCAAISASSPRTSPGDGRDAEARRGPTACWCAACCARRPAGRAGHGAGRHHPGDQRHEVRNTATMLNQIAALPPGTVARVNVLRDGKPTQLAVTVGERPAPRDQR